MACVPDESIRAGLDKKPHEVQAMFDGVAQRYDLMNTLMTGGLDRVWRAQTRKALELRPGQRVLDLACGTGVSTVELAKSGAYAVGADLSTGMLVQGTRTSSVQRAEIPLVAGDALHLPFADAAFDAITVSFGLRNVVQTGDALREMARVVRPGGRLVVCEFSRPTWAPFRAAYYDIALRAIQMVAKQAASNPEAYRYLAESIKAWPDQEELALLIDDSGWDGAEWRNLAGGIVALHRAVKPPRRGY